MSARHLLHLRIRTEGIDENPVEPDRVPNAIGASGSVLLHAAIVLLAIWPLASLLPSPFSSASDATDGAATKPKAADAAKKDPEILTLSPEEFASLQGAKNAVPEDLGITLDDDTPHDAAFGYEVGKIVDRAASLYPFLTQRLDLEPAANSRGGGRSLTNPLKSAEPPRTPLQLTERELQQIIDTAWSRRHRWEPFQPIAALANASDASDGQLPRLIREYVEQNGLQLYADDATRDGRLWVQLGLAADHLDFVEYISRYVRERTGTKASVELLFLLEKLAQASLDALVTLIDIDRQQDLRWTMRTHRFAYAAIATIQDHYKTKLAEMRLTKREELIEYYDRVRIMILQAVLDTTPNRYRAADARFLIGSIYWRRGKRADAERVWRAMQPDSDGSYDENASRILAELRAWNGRAIEDIDARRINRILDAENGLWLIRSYERLRKFGYRFDTF
jgi:hypothetical protein